MITIKSKSINEAWVELVKQIINYGYSPDDKEYYKAERTIVEIENPIIEAPHKFFPRNEQELNIINNYLCTGENERDVWHEWTKLYYHRLFDSPNSQIEYIIKELSKKSGGKAVACTWRKEIDQDAERMPCMLTIWCQSRDGKIDLHVHGQEGDIYKKSIMNMQEFVSLQRYLGNILNLKTGRFIFSLDFGFIFTKNKEHVLDIIKKL
ncbi:MAG: thymidylate synthase [Clostridia bacterium]